jgi:ubiquinone/menaquinone biosynthesis C-methylase UbiE
MDSRQPARDELAADFARLGVVDAHQYRPPYPPEAFGVLAQLITDRPRTVLDIGAGEGALARPLAGLVDHVDAVDISAAMVDAGRRRPGGRQRNPRWIIGAVETAELGGPYALVTAGASLHWMSWQSTLARLARVMTDNAFLATRRKRPGVVSPAGGVLYRAVPLDGDPRPRVDAG